MLIFKRKQKLSFEEEVAERRRKYQESLLPRIHNAADWIGYSLAASNTL